MYKEEGPEEGLGGQVANHARQLRQLLANKNTVEYESRRTAAKEATDAVKRAERFVGWAHGLIAPAKL